LHDDSITSTQLLVLLLDPQAQAVWVEFDGRYRPILAGCARRRGLSAEQAADVAQETLARFAQAYRAGQYDRGRGRLRAWLLGIARNVMREAFREPRGPQSIDTAENQEAPDDAELWAHERRVEILRRGLDALMRESRFSPSSLRAFERVALGGESPELVAADLGLTRHDVYVAKHRVAHRLRAVVRRLEAIYDEDDAA